MKRKQASEGSGVIVDGQGYILTNNHVVSGTDKLTVRLFDGRELKGTVKGADPKTDLAVVQIEAKALPVPPLGDSDRIRVGEWVMAVGDPLQFEKTVTVGVVSGKGRVALRGSVHKEEMARGRFRLIITELPYTVNKSSLIERIAELASDSMSARMDSVGTSS